MRGVYTYTFKGRILLISVSVSRDLRTSVDCQAHLLPCEAFHEEQNYKVSVLRFILKVFHIFEI